MGSLADLDPPIALGALDGRYRGVVAPRDHLSEPALNRARVKVEVEWLIHLTDRQVVPVCAASPATRRRGCAPLSTSSAPRRSRRWPAPSESPSTTSRRSSISSGAALDDRPG